MSIAALEELLGYRFADPRLLEQALTHRSFGATHNERLEFIGDAVLNCAVAHALYLRFPDLPEGELSRARSNLVNQPTLQRLANAMGLGSWLRLGEGETRTGGASRPSILADALEAVFGAAFEDGGYDAARALVDRVYAPALARLVPGAVAKDPKTRLQEWLQGRGIALPEYEVVGITGEAHAQTFEVKCRVPSLGVETRATGSSRRAAEQSAAEIACRRLDDE